MTNTISRFEQPIFVTRPLMPDLEKFSGRLKDVWDAKWLSNGGAQHKTLEEQLKVFLKSPGLCLFNNGTIALMVAVQSLRLQGEVITTPFTFPATTHVLAWNGITPVFCDVDQQRLTIDPEQIESLITNRTTGILGVHVYGMPCHVERIQEIADRHGLRVIYDAAHAFGTEIDGRGIGTFGDISMFSFHPTKLFHTAEGGALTFNDANLKPRIDLLKNFGIRNEFEVLLPGINGKMNELSAVMGQLVLEMVADEWTKRTRIRQQYTRSLKNMPGITLIEVPEGVSDSLQYYAIRVCAEEFGASRDDVYALLRMYNVNARKYFFPLTSSYPCYRQLATAEPGHLPEANRAAQEVLCLPYYGELTAEEIETICAIVRSAANGNRAAG